MKELSPYYESVDNGYRQLSYEEVVEDLQKEIERLKEEIKGYEQERERVLNVIDERNHKAIEYIKTYNTEGIPFYEIIKDDLLNILQGSDKE